MFSCGWKFPRPWILAVLVIISFSSLWIWYLILNDFAQNKKPVFTKCTLSSPSVAIVHFLVTAFPENHVIRRLAVRYQLKSSDYGALSFLQNPWHKDGVISKLHKSGAKKSRLFTYCTFSNDSKTKHLKEVTLFLSYSRCQRFSSLNKKHNYPALDTNLSVAH